MREFYYIYIIVVLTKIFKKVENVYSEIDKAKYEISDTQKKIDPHSPF